MREPPELRADALHVAFGSTPVLRGIDLALRPGDFVGVTGPNGAGKSTLLRALCGLLQARPGRILLGSVPLAHLGRRELARRIAYLPQGLEEAPAFSVEYVVQMGRYPRLGRFRAAGAEDRHAVEEAIAWTDVAHLRTHAYAALSGGERQRVRLARTLATRAPILLLDEPFAGLDVRHVLELARLLRACAAGGRIVAVTLHDLDLAYRHCDRIVVLDAGRTAADGPARSVLEPDLLRRVFGVAATPLPHAGRRALLLEPLTREPEEEFGGPGSPAATS